MKRFVIALVIGGALAGQPAQAQVPLRYDLGAGIGFPSSPGIANQYWGAGYTLSAGARWRLNSRWSIGTDLGFARFDWQEPDGPQPTVPPAPGGAPPAGGALHVVPILMAGEFALSEWSNTRPFVSAHLGYVRVRTGDVESFSTVAPATLPPHPESDAVGIGFGLGVRTLLTGTADLVVDVGWRMAFAKPDRIAWVPARIAVRF